MSRQLKIESSENVEEYLEALWASEENGKPIAKVGWIAKRLHISPPSVVEMLKKLEKRGYVKYYPYRGIKLLEPGRDIAKSIVRNHRLVEVLMKKTLNIEVNEGVACGVEHHMTKEFTDALCTLLNHPRKCPHENDIPIGTCCQVTS